MKHYSKEIESLIAAYAEGTLTETEAKRLAQWVHDDGHQDETIENLLTIDSTIDKLKVANWADTEQALQHVKSKMEQPGKKTFMRFFERAAAILFIPLLLGITAYFMSTSSHDERRLITISTPPGTVLTQTLPDGTQVKLNSSSTLVYPDKFSSDLRQVSLSGEAYFAVTHDAHRPFTVSTPTQAQIKVLGTRFNVEAYPTDDRVTAMLEEGKIAMRYPNQAGKEIEQTIVPGQSAIFYPATGMCTIQMADATVITSWKDGRLVFRNTPLRQVLRSISKSYGVTFRVTNPKAYNNRFTGTLEQNDIQHVLKILSLSSNMKFRLYSDGESQGSKVVEIY